MKMKTEFLIVKIFTGKGMFMGCENIYKKGMFKGCENIYKKRDVQGM